MGLILILWAGMALVVVWALVQIHWTSIVAALPFVGCGLAVLVVVQVVRSTLTRPPQQQPVAAPSEPSRPEAWTWDRTFETELGSVVEELGDPSPVRLPSDTADEVWRLRLALAEARGIADALQGDALARVRGRAHSWKGEYLSLAVADAGGDWQRITVRVMDQDDRQFIGDGGALVEVVCHWTGGRLVVERILSVEDCDDPLPELPEVKKTGGVPEWFDSAAKNSKRELLKASDGSSSVSDLKVHLVWGTKRRGSVLTAPMVERLKVLADDVVTAKGLGRLLAVNGEADHVHLALWLPVTVSGSEALGVIKGYLSRHLRREFPELVAHDAESLWQRGGYVGSIGNGGDLSVVLKYIAEQQVPEAVQMIQEGLESDREGEE